MSTPRIAVGDAVLQQFLRDWQGLQHELHLLEGQKRAVVPGGAGVLAAERVNARVHKLSTSFERQRALFADAFGADWNDRPEMDELRALLKEIWATISRVLQLGQPDFGRGSLAKIVNDAQAKLQAAGAALHASVGAPEHPIITAAGVPPALAANPLLAIAIIIDVLRLVVLGRRPKK